MKIKVKVIKKERGAVLVEYGETPAGGGEVRTRRLILPPDALDEKTSEIDAVSVETGIDYGGDWETYLEGVVDPEATVWRIAEYLRQAGIWTCDDLRDDPNAAIGAIQRAYRLDYINLLTSCKGVER